jgi:hypothetical protein
MAGKSKNPDSPFQRRLRRYASALNEAMKASESLIMPIASFPDEADATPRAASTKIQT